MDSNLKLWYEEEGNKWIDGLPLGNGRLGAMVIGNVLNERIQINEDTLWSGEPKKRNKKSLEDLEKARKLIFSGKYKEAENLINKKLLGNWSESYEPMADLNLEFNHKKSVSNYRKELDLNTATVKVMYEVDGVQFVREVFISKPSNIIMIKVSCSEKGKLNFKLSLRSLLKYNCININSSSLELRGKAPIKALPSYVDEKDSVIYDDEKGMNFEVLLEANSTEGNMFSENNYIIFENSDEVILKVAAHTSFNGFKNEAGTYGQDVHKLCKETLKAVDKKSYEEIYKDHLEEYKSLFNRMRFTLGKDSNYKVPTNKRIQNIINGKQDLSLIALYFQYGRYLLISSSRKGSQAANLQGIWNEDLRPAWSSNYTTNINLEMNYWPAEVCNLSECHEPLFNLIRETSINGINTAKDMYGCNGFTINHNVDLWRQSYPADGNAEWAYWPMAGAWLCSHIWEHYRFTMDKKFLEENYPLMKGAAEFLLDWLIEDNEGNLVTCPSTSPENSFLTEDNEKCCVSMASTMDMSLCRNLFNNCINAMEVLNINDKFKEQLINAKERLYPYKITKEGTLQEWFKDFKESEVGHRHLSHLFGLYPGNEITIDNSKEIYDAARKSLERRLNNGGGHTGWSCAWVICLFARLKDSVSAYKYIKVLISKLTYSNLFNVCPPFQIDGNLGGTAAIAEMLVQSHEGYIELLPSLPDEWASGEVKGIKARGGFEVNIKWEYGNLMIAEIKSNVDSLCRIKYKDKITIKDTNCKSIDNIVEFNAERDKVYSIRLISK